MATVLVAAPLMALAACSRGENNTQPTPNQHAPAEAAPPTSDHAAPTPSHASAPSQPQSGEPHDAAPLPTSPPPAAAPKPAAPDAARLQMGAAAFKQGQCFMCHGPEGKGTQYGPDLTDGSWDHCDGSVEGILAVITAGIPTDQFKNHAYTMKMPPATMFVPNQDQLLALAQYVHSLSQK